MSSHLFSPLWSKSWSLAAPPGSQGGELSARPPAVGTVHFSRFQPSGRNEKTLLVCKHLFCAFQRVPKVLSIRLHRGRAPNGLRRERALRCLARCECLHQIGGYLNFLSYLPPLGPFPAPAPVPDRLLSHAEAFGSCPGIDVSHHVSALPALLFDFLCVFVFPH